MQTIDEALKRLQTSSFRAGFRLKEKDRAYILEKGLDTMLMAWVERRMQDYSNRSIY